MAWTVARAPLFEAPDNKAYMNASTTVCVEMDFKQTFQIVN